MGLVASAPVLVTPPGAFPASQSQSNPDSPTFLISPRKRSHTTLEDVSSAREVQSGRAPVASNSGGREDKGKSREVDSPLFKTSSTAAASRSKPSACCICLEACLPVVNPFEAANRAGPSSFAAVRFGLYIGPKRDGHLACLDCAVEYVQKKLENPSPNKVFPVLCPAHQCDYQLSDVDAARILGESNLQSWNCHKHSEAQLSLICPNQLCAKRIVRCNDLLNPRVECPYSLQVSCGTCMVIWHEGYSCEDYQSLPVELRNPEDVALLALARSQGWSRCFGCKILIENTRGCLQITCSLCKTESCYRCGSSWSLYGCTRDPPCRDGDNFRDAALFPLTASAAKDAPPSPSAVLVQPETGWWGWLFNAGSSVPVKRDPPPLPSQRPYRPLRRRYNGLTAGEAQEEAYATICREEDDIEAVRKQLEMEEKEARWAATDYAVLEAKWREPGFEVEDEVFEREAWRDWEWELRWQHEALRAIVEEDEEMDRAVREYQEEQAWAAVDYGPDMEDNEMTDSFIVREGVQHSKRRGEVDHHNSDSENQVKKKKLDRTPLPPHRSTGSKAQRTSRVRHDIRKPLSALVVAGGPSSFRSSYSLSASPCDSSSSSSSSSHSPSFASAIDEQYARRLAAAENAFQAAVEAAAREREGALRELDEEGERWSEDDEDGEGDEDGDGWSDYGGGEEEEGEEEEFEEEEPDWEEAGEEKYDY